ncbi:YciI family protein [Phenylobacterium montanum]|uniref:YciI family protein n=1 Tax=Phenylobacterium montanum TaxID=2823693 RepID=A0A975IVD0_9CAUL|nr:YciI family protein [Caulobacter sp. S6]QUD88650.1 YciI family protein [Caulobacter sp. S6]
MRYLLMLYADEKAGLAIPPDAMAGFMSQMYAYREALAKAGAFIETAPLMPTTEACVVKVVDGGISVQDGPYAETREQLGGYYIIEAPDMDAARKWAARCPAATWGSIEVRQIRELPPR